MGRTALLADGYRKTERGVLNRMLQRNIIVNVDGNEATLAYGLHLVDNPSYSENISLVISDGDNAYTATFSGAASGEVIAKAILVHDITKGTWRHTSTMDTRTAISIGKAVDETGDALEVYAYGIVLQPKTAAGHANVSNTGASQTGYIINVSAVNTVNYDFSPTISAALTIGSDGSTTGGNASTGGGENGGNSGQGGTSGSGSTGGSTQGNYTLTLAVNPADSGTLTATVNGNAVASGSQVPAGAEVRLTASPASGKQLNNIVMNSGSGNTTVSNRRFTMPAANVTVTANFIDDTGQGDVN